MLSRNWMTRSFEMLSHAREFVLKNMILTMLRAAVVAVVPLTPREEPMGAVAAGALLAVVAGVQANRRKQNHPVDQDLIQSQFQDLHQDPDPQNHHFPRARMVTRGTPTAVAVAAAAARAQVRASAESMQQARVKQLVRGMAPDC